MTNVLGLIHTQRREGNYSAQENKRISEADVFEYGENAFHFVY